VAIGRKPRARADDLVIEEVEDELLVYDRVTDYAHCLSATAARVWRACDGQATPKALGAELDLDAATVSRALEELADRELLDSGQRLDADNGVTRRQVAVRAAKLGTAAATAPLILSVTAPMAAAAVTPTPAQCAQFNNKSCSGCCQIAGCCCCCESGGNCKLCYPTSLCSAINVPNCANPHCSCQGGEFPADTPCASLPGSTQGGGCPECCGCVSPGNCNCNNP
jgi:hypothetical protein